MRYDGVPAAWMTDEEDLGDDDDDDDDDVTVGIRHHVHCS